jgi:hypothetical protein
MGKVVLIALTTAGLVCAGALVPRQTFATTFRASAAPLLAIESIPAVEKVVCRAYPWWYPRRWAVYASAWPCYPSYSYYYYPRYPYYYYRRDPHVEPGFIRRSF